MKPQTQIPEGNDVRKNFFERIFHDMKEYARRCRYTYRVVRNT